MKRLPDLPQSVILLILISLSAFTSSASAFPTISSKDDDAFGVNVTLWNNTLNRWLIEDGELHGIALNLVNYTGIAHDPDFNEYISQLKTANLTAVEAKRESLYAFFINVYNALAIKMIIDHPCKMDLFGKCGKIASIRDIGTIVPFKQVWGKNAGVVGQKTWSLDDVENYLRDPNPFKEDPRLHAAIVCASISCPNVRKGAYTVDSIDTQLNETFNDFLSNPKKGMFVDRDNKKVKLSMIFNWFETDFTGYFEDKDATVLDFILTYLSPNHPEYTWLHNNKDNVKIEHFGYDWDVNAVKESLPCNSSSRPCYQLWALLVTLGALLFAVCIVSIIVYCYRHRKRAHYQELG